MPLTRVTGNIVKEATLPESKLINPYVNVSGDTMTGTLYLATNGLVAGTNQLVLSGGNVGVKNLSPSYALDVVGDVRASGQLITNSLLNVPAISISSDGTAGSPAVYFGNDTNTGIYRTATGTIAFSSSGNLSFSINTSRLYNASGVVSNFRSGSINSIDNSLEYSSSLDTLYLGRDANTLNIRTNNSQNRIVINSIGQVSIGTANTAFDSILNVAGKINATGYYGINLNDLPVVSVSRGGTGLTSYSAGDLLYYTSGTSLSRLSSPAQESVLIITANGVPYWSSVPLAVTYGGTGVTNLPSNGQLLIGNGNSFTLNTISAGTGITVLNGSGTIGIGVTNIPNASLANSSVTINTGTGLAGGGTLALGGTLNLTNSGVTSLTAGTGITISGSTGSVTVNNSGVVSATGTNGVSVSGSTGNIVFSLNPSFAPTFAGLSLNTPLAIPSGGTGISSVPLVNQILYGNGTSGYDLLTVVGNNISITPDFNNKTLRFSTNFNSISAGTGISVNNNDGSITVENTGVTSAFGNNGITASNSTGSVTFSLNQNYSPTFSGLTLTSPLTPANGGTGTSVAPLANQILYGNGSGGYARLTLVGVGVTITPDYNTNTLTLISSGAGGAVTQIVNGSSSVAIPSNGDIVTTTGNIEVLRINNQQNIGIGITTPAFKIDFGTAFLANPSISNRLIGLTTQSVSGLFSGFGRSLTGSGILVAGTPTALGVGYTSSGVVSDFGFYSTDGSYNWSSVLSIYNDGTYGIGAGTTVGVGTTYSPTGAAHKVTDTRTTSTSQIIIDTYSSTLYRTAKYLVQIRNSDNNFYQSTEILLTHDGTNTYMTEYATISSAASLGVIDSNISSGAVRLVITPTYANNMIRVYRTILGTMN